MVNNLQEFLATLNSAVNSLVKARELVGNVALHPSWINNTGKTEIKIEFAAVVNDATVKLAECNDWLQTL